MKTFKRFLNLFCTILLVFGFLPVHTAEAVTYREIVAQFPLIPVYTQSVRVWMNSDTLPGETAGLSYLLNLSWSYMVDGTYDNTTMPGANWYADIPPLPVGSTVAIQLYTRDENGILIGSTDFLTFYTVQGLPATIYVDDDWAGTMEGADPDGSGPATNFGGDAFPVIHEAVAGVAPGGTIQVAAGNYYESDLLINKPLTLAGAGAGQTVIGPKVTDARQCNPLTSAHQGIIVAADDVFLQDFTLDGNADGTLSGDHNYRMGITTNYSVATYDHLTVQNVTIQHVWYRGLQIRSKSGETSSGHRVDYVTINDLAGCTLTGEPRGQAFGILLYDAAGEIANSSVSSAGSGIAASNYTAVPLLANIHHNSIVSVDVQAYTLTFNAAGTLFEHNLASYSNPANNAIALLVDQPQGFTIRNNSLVGARIGIFMGRQSGPVTQFVIGEGNHLVGPGSDVLTSSGILADGSSFAANVNTNFTLEKTHIAEYGTGVRLNRVDSTGINSAVVRENNLVMNDTGVLAGVRSNLSLTFNRIVGNSFAGLVTSLSQVAETNWWGCNEGPTGTDCDGYVGPVDANPWLMLNAAAADSSLVPGGTTQVQSNLLMNSNAQDTSAAGHVPDGIPAEFEAPDGGVVDPAGGESLNGSFPVFEFTPPAAPQVFPVCVAVDYEQVCADVTVENVAPQAAADAYSGTEDTLLTVPQPGVLVNDSDLNQTSLSAVLVSDVSHGTLTLNPNGSFTYLPAENWFGVDHFTYRASDGSLESGSATVTLTIENINDAPTASNQSLSLAEDESKSLTLAAADVDNDSLTWLVDEPQHGSLSGTAPDLTYTPFLNYYGSDSFTFRVNDGQVNSNLATVSISISPVNDPPTVNPDDYIIGMNGVLNVLQPGVLANDLDPEGSLMRAFLSANVQHGTLTLNQSGSFVYVPASGWSGVDGFSYYASDGSLNSSAQIVTLTVTSTNQAPLAAADEYSLLEDGSLSVPLPGVLANDTDADGNPLLAFLRMQPVPANLTLNMNGAFTYTPPPNFNGEVTFTYAAYDGLAYSENQVVTLTVIPVNDRPLAAADAYTLDEDTPLDVSAQDGLLANDSDVDGDGLTPVLVSSPEHGSLVLNADGSFNYTPDPDYFGEDSFTYQASDGELLSETVTVTLSIQPVNDPPVPDEVSVYIWMNEILAGFLTASDVDSAGLSFSLETAPTHGSVDIAADGAFTYTPEQDYTGDDQFTFRVDDGDGGFNTGTVTISIYPVNPVWLPLIIR